MNAPLDILIIDRCIEQGQPTVDALDMIPAKAALAVAPDDIARHLESGPSRVVLELLREPFDGIEIIRDLAQRPTPPELIIFSHASLRIRTAAERLARARGLEVRANLGKADLDELKGALRDVPHQRPSGARVDRWEPGAEDLRKAIDNGDIQVLFQPKIRLDTLAPVSVEALARWSDPVRGPVSPGHFISVAEHNDLIGPLTDTVIDTAFASARDWSEQGLPLRVALNVSGASLANLALPDHIASRAADHALAPERITVEITETWFEQYPVDALDIMTRLRMKGFELAIDDFGTGHSTMLRLKQVPFSELKLDKSLIRGAASDAVARRIVASSIDLGHALGLAVIAEGVDNQEDWDLITDLGCDVGQGYFVARPMSAQALCDWYRRWSAAGGG